MKIQIILSTLVFGVVIFVQTAVAETPELITPPATDAEKEAVYTTSIENRSAGILKVLAVADTAKSNTVHDAIVSQYRALRARDAAIDAKLKADGKEISYANRASQLAAESKSLHEKFLATLAENLTPEQVEQVKDGLTYKKVKVTYDAYCAIVPDLTDADKAKILELLKAAREEAMDGGSAFEKSDIFQKYKKQINDHLNTHGHDTAKAFKDWEAKQEAAKKQAANADAKPTEPAK